jgi:hypothetical protein
LCSRNGAGPLDIGEDQALIISGAAVERGDGGRIGAAGDGQAVRLLKGAESGGGVRIGGKAEALAKLFRPAGGDLDLGQARPAGAINGEAADEPVIGRIAGECHARVRDWRGRGGERVKGRAVVGCGGSKAGVDVAHRIAHWRARAFTDGVDIRLAQHHVCAERGAAVAGTNGAERLGEVGAVRQQGEEGAVGAVRPDRLEVALRIEGQKRRPGLEAGEGGGCQMLRARRRRLRRRPISRDRSEAEREARGAQKGSQRRHGLQNRPRRKRRPTLGQSCSELVRDAYRIFPSFLRRAARPWTRA